MRPSRRAWRVLALSSLAAGGACTSMRPLPSPTPTPLPVRDQQEVRLALKSGGYVYLRAVRVEGDSIVGLRTRAGEETGQRAAVATNEVLEVAVRRGDVWRTIGAVVGGTLAVFTFVLLAACATLSVS